MAIYPGAVSSDLDLLVAQDNSRSTLAEPLDDSEVGVDVADGTEFVQFEVVSVDDEQMQITSISVNTLTVTRGYNGTTPAAHSNGASIRGLYVEAHHNLLVDEIIAIETVLDTYFNVSDLNDLIVSTVDDFRVLGGDAIVLDAASDIFIRAQGADIVIESELDIVKLRSVNIDLLVVDGNTPGITLGGNTVPSLSLTYDLGASGSEFDELWVREIHHSGANMLISAEGGSNLRLVGSGATGIELESDAHMEGGDFFLDDNTLVIGDSGNAFLKWDASGNVIEVQSEANGDCFIGAKGWLGLYANTDTTFYPVFSLFGDGSASLELDDPVGPTSKFSITANQGVTVNGFNPTFQLNHPNGGVIHLGYDSDGAAVTGSRIRGEDLTVESFSPLNLVATLVDIQGADIQLDSEKKLILGNSGDTYIRYRADDNALYMQSNSGEQLDIVTETQLSIYANTGPDGSGTYQPAIEMKTDGTINIQSGDNKDIQLIPDGTGFVDIQGDIRNTTENIRLLILDTNSVEISTDVMDNDTSVYPLKLKNEDDTSRVQTQMYKTSAVNNSTPTKIATHLPKGQFLLCFGDGGAGQCFDIITVLGGSIQVVNSNSDGLAARTYTTDGSTHISVQLASGTAAFMTYALHVQYNPA